MGNLPAASRDERRWRAYETAKAERYFKLDWQTPDDYAFTPLKSRRSKRHQSKKMISSAYGDEDTVAGVDYSFDAYSGPSQGSDIFGTLVEQAEVKYENKVFDNLVKTEYEMVETSEEDSDEEFELIDI